MLYSNFTMTQEFVVYLYTPKLNYFNPNRHKNNPFKHMNIVLLDKVNVLNSDCLKDILLQYNFKVYILIL